MDRAVHYGKTREWAIEEGFSDEEAETIARADDNVDRKYSGRLWRNKGYHFAWLGARRRARRFFARAVEQCDLEALGEALHCIQDAVGHGVHGHFYHWRGIDSWERRSERVRAALERESRALLARYREDAEHSA